MAKVVDEFDMLRVDEGLKLTVYQDHLGYWTVGIGHLLTKIKDKAKAIQILDNLLGRKTNGVITEKEARQIFADDVAKVKRDIKNSTILSPIYDKVSDTRKLGIINMVFQLGLKGA
ncbi:glycoside hydrolase family protein, partial [Xanthomonadaceae bacterium JHOS43]|nr:glycoside hydrolase family protein [Xanthomonadaceae bacterium JHOS43]